LSAPVWFGLRQTLTYPEKLLVTRRGSGTLVLMSTVQRSDQFRFYPIAEQEKYD